ncbi:uncharacterized protein LOC106178853 [Lingula anatina]|uniref:Uncharacterized protein LOC106178853 n=1 Tax=Lingula anatina TaxID=7574 RepID=A0A1S3K5Y2_LINAN|nr:uncharacterized protein LOC106178853 [Lingula anatina]|eukprot:XP_013417661.1 uncharacterized protein LOC106178853 [Lingula anatina]
MTGNWWRVFSFLLLSATAVEGSTFYMDNSTGSCTSSYKDMYMYSSSHTVKAWNPGKTQMFASYCYMVFNGYLNKLAMNFSSFSATSSINLRFDDFYGYSLKELLILDNSSSTPSSTYYTIGPYLRVNLTMSIPYSTGYSFEFNVWIYNGTSTTLGTRALPISMDNSQHCSPNFIYVNSGQYLWVTAWSPSNTYRSTTSSCTMYFRPANSVDIMAISFASGSLSISNSHVTLSFYDETGTSRDKLKSKGGSAPLNPI